ncbi:hypothetical protein QVD17_23369 [Tagetes erecta]|uniref:Uncharacterized protein n=1 Tax=Tagetes erecta TaxID=13708 RepID=A0AAD8NUH4_TARER|nr:hypothetical protein QVD17_23369 [Tagetes erecta]
MSSVQDMSSWLSSERETENMLPVTETGQRKAPNGNHGTSNNQVATTEILKKIASDGSKVYDVRRRI